MIYGAESDPDALLPPSGTTVPASSRDLLPPSRRPPVHRRHKKRGWLAALFSKPDPDALMGDYYSPPAGYYPPPSYNYGPPRGPGGLPGDRATLDVKAFIPAQYEHVSLSPVSGMAIVGVGVLLVLLLSKK